MVSIALSTMALLLVLSAFNGLEALVKSLFRSFDPDIRVELQRGKRFLLAPDLLDCIRATEGVARVVEVVEDNALLRYRDGQLVVRVKGVSDEFLRECRLAPYVVLGDLCLARDGVPFALVGSGVRYALGIYIDDPFQVLQLFYPRCALGGPVLPGQLYRRRLIRPGAVFAVERQFDERYVIVPLAFAAGLMGVGDGRTALEVQVLPGVAVGAVQRRLKLLLPPDFVVLNGDEQQAALMKAIYVERLFVFLTFSFILLIASLNTFFILSMLLLDKRRDVGVLYALGARARDVRWIFLFEGLCIALSGAALGMVAAWVLSWLQQRFGIVSLGTSTSLVEAYPIKRQVSDFVYTGLCVVVLTLVAAFRPVRLAARLGVGGLLLGRGR